MLFNICQDMKSGDWVVTRLKDKTKVKFSNYISAHDYIVREITKAGKFKISQRERVSI